MAEKRSLEDVLADLKAAEKEFNEKCLKYGITEKHKKKKDDINDTSESKDLVQNEGIQDIEQTEESSENKEEISEN